jgi:hypothetical protein
MTITKLGDCTGASHPLGTGGGQTYNITVPAAGIPVGSTVVVYGFFASGATQFLDTITDTKGNTYTIRKGAGAQAPCMILADSVISTALVSGNQISVKMTASDAYVVVNAAWFSSPCYFHDAVEKAYTGTAGDGGALTTFTANELLLGFFGVYSNSSDAAPSIATPGSGYTNQVGYTKTNTAPP